MNGKKETKLDDSALDHVAGGSSTVFNVCSDEPNEDDPFFVPDSQSSQNDPLRFGVDRPIGDIPPDHPQKRSREPVID